LRELFEYVAHGRVLFPRFHLDVVIVVNEKIPPNVSLTMGHGFISVQIARSAVSIADVKINSRLSSTAAGTGESYRLVKQSLAEEIPSLLEMHPDFTLNSSFTGFLQPCSKWLCNRNDGHAFGAHVNNIALLAHTR
jgi:hypothetical protein